MAVLALCAAIIACSCDDVDQRVQNAVPIGKDYQVKIEDTGYVLVRTSGNNISIVPPKGSVSQSSEMVNRKIESIAVLKTPEGKLIAGIASNQGTTATRGGYFIVDVAKGTISQYLSADEWHKILTEKYKVASVPLLLADDFATATKTNTP